MSIQASFRMSFCCLALLFSACGGGSGGRSEGGNDGDHSEDKPVELIEDSGVPLEYAGSRDQATITSQNLAEFVYAVIGQPANSRLITEGNEDVGQTGALQEISRDIHAAFLKGGGQPDYGKKSSADTFLGDNPRRGIQEEVRGRRLCDSGDIDFVGDISQLGTGVISMRFDGCQFGDAMLDGIAHMTIHSFDREFEVITSSTLSFKRLSMTVSDVEYDITGSILTNITSQRESITSNITVEEIASGKQFMFSDFLQQRDLTFGSHETVSGRIYIPAHGYVDIKTDLPFIYDWRSNLLEGRFELSGAGLSSSVITIINDNNWVEARLNSNGLSFAPVFMRRDRLDSPENSSLMDSDGDGMHDSWEVFYGFDPFNVNDAILDPDGDSKANLVEYLNGTNPVEPNDGEAPYQLMSLHENSAMVFPAGRTVNLRFKLSAVWDEEILQVQIYFPTNFDFVENDGCRKIGHMASCTVSTDNIVMNQFGSRWTELGLAVVLPEETGDYQYTAIIRSYPEGNPDGDLLHQSGFSFGSSTDIGIFTQSFEVVPAFVAVEVELNTESAQAPLDNVFRYTVIVRNEGSLASESMAVTLTYADIVHRVSGSSSCAAGVCTVNFSFPSIPPLSSRSQFLEVFVPATEGPQTVESSVVVTPGSAETNYSYVNSTNSLALVPPDSQMLLEARPYKNHVTRELMPDMTWKARWVLELGVFPELTDPNGDYVELLTFSVSLPPGIEFDGDLPSACSESADTIICTVTGLTDRWAQSITLPLVATADGIYNYSATLTSAAIDDPTDNTVQLATYVGKTLADIQALIDAAVDGETIQILPGYYYGDLGYPDKDIHLVSSDGPSQTFISSLADGIQPGPGGSISGFTFTYGLTAITLNNSNTLVTDNIFDHLNNNSNYVWGTSFLGFSQLGKVSAVRLQGDSQAVIERNIVRNTDCGTGFWAAFRLEDNAFPIIRNNLVANNDCHGVYFSTLSPGAPVIVNNTFVNNDIALWIPEDARIAGTYIGNNIIYGNNVGIRTETDCGALCGVLQSNLVFGNDIDYMDSPDQTGENGNLSEDPLFTDVDNGDFSLQVDSPAIDAGIATNAPAEDFSGDPRPMDGDGSGTAEPDIGAYEFQ